MMSGDGETGGSMRRRVTEDFGGSEATRVTEESSGSEATSGGKDESHNGSRTVLDLGSCSLQQMKSNQRRHDNLNINDYCILGVANL